MIGRFFFLPNLKSFPLFTRSLQLPFRLIGKTMPNLIKTRHRPQNLSSYSFDLIISAISVNFLLCTNVLVKLNWDLITGRYLIGIRWIKESVFVVTLISYTVFVFVFFSDRVKNKLSVQAIVGLSLEFELTVNVNFLPNVFCLPGKVQLKRCDTNMNCHYYLHNPAINIYSHKMLDRYRLANETTSLPLFKIQ